MWVRGPAVVDTTLPARAVSATGAMIRQHGHAVRVTIRVQPRASKTEIVGAHGDALRIRIAAPPVDGAANRELLKFLAKRMGVGLAAVRLIGSETARNKIVEIDDVVESDVRRALLG